MGHFGSIASSTVPTLRSLNGSAGLCLSIAHGDNHLHRGASKDAPDLLSSLKTLSCTQVIWLP
jgi:hypothetical protein